MLIAALTWSYLFQDVTASTPRWDYGPRFTSRPVCEIAAIYLAQVTPAVRIPLLYEEDGMDYACVPRDAADEPARTEVVPRRLLP